MRSALVTVVLVIAVSAKAFTQDSEAVSPDAVLTDLRAAAAIEDSTARLKAFDTIAQKYSKVTQTQVNDAGKWTVSESTNPMDDSQCIIFSLTADSGAGTYSDPVRLVIRFQSGETEVYIVWNSYLGDDVRVTSRIGKQPSDTSKWSESSDSKASFYPDDPIELIKNLEGVDTYVAKVTPFGENPITAIFDVRGLKSIASNYADALQW